MDEYQGGSPTEVVIAVPDDAVSELVEADLAEEMLVLRGAVIDAVVSVGVDAAALVTLLQTPDTVRRFAAWITDWARRRNESISVTYRKDGRQVELRVTGDVPVDAVADFIAAACRDSSSEPPKPNPAID